MYNNTARKANPKETKPAFEFSAPMLGPTRFCSLIKHGAGNAPPFKSPDNDSASSKVKLPEICVFPFVIGLITVGAEYTTLSMVIATIRSLFSVVICPHSSVPSAVIPRSTVIFPSR